MSFPRIYTSEMFPAVVSGHNEQEEADLIPVNLREVTVVIRESGVDDMIMLSGEPKEVLKTLRAAVRQVQQAQARMP